MNSTPGTWSSLWEVFVLFTIPVGGGIPAGVVLAKTKGIGWEMMLVLYFISDVVLACVFEPMVLLVKWFGRRSPAMHRMIEAMKRSTSKTIAKYGVSPRPHSLILLSFGVDPMTGRTAALAAGHGFISGWMLAIAGDMLFFALIMVSTLCLDNILGDGTWTAVIIMVAMIVVPMIWRKIKGPPPVAPA